MLLGIKKKEIAHLVVIENILLGILAFVLAIPIGFLFSQFVSLVIVNLLGIPKTLFISLNFVSIGLLIIYFLIRKQLLILFCVPAISAILCSFVMMSSLNNVYQQILGDKFPIIWEIASLFSLLKLPRYSVSGHLS